MTFQSKHIKQLEQDGWIVLKTIRLNTNGWPDLICLRNSEAMFIELKEGNDTLKPLQKKRINQLRAQGFEAFCLHKDKGIIY